MHFKVVLLFICVGSLVVSCQTRQAEKQSRQEQVGSPNLSSNEGVGTHTETPSIRGIDFGNIDYPNYPNYLDDRSRTVTIKAGNIKPSYVYYGDLTGDSVEDAVVVLLVKTHGTAIPQHVYFYATHGDSLNLLWEVEAGDRGDGGIRQISVQQGDLVVEMYGRNKLLGKVNEFDPESSVCCPKFVTRTRYRWNGKYFRRLEKSEVFANATGDNSNLMSPYPSSRLPDGE